MALPDRGLDPVPAQDAGKDHASRVRPIDRNGSSYDRAPCVAPSSADATRFSETLADHTTV
ncbi:hypothetical protein [Komagataeibacter europaeus]|uniref:hypothetical protein n=1 Tax=Komagataeibacter europaeus TaxID=33995 RepID=UPI0012DF56CA|nr:hypothetical protein [Komagataeibacter europaeus]